MANSIDKHSKTTIKHAVKPLAQVRRPEYEIKDENWIKALLHRGTFGTLGTAYKNQPFLNTVLFIFDEAEHAIFFHTAKIGRARSNCELNPKVCFSVVEMGRIIPSEEAVDFSVEYNSVVVFGTVKVIQADKDSQSALQKLMNKYASHLKPGEDYHPIRSKDLKRTAVYKITIEHWSAKQQSGPEDHPGAFYFPQMA
ncbi:MAG: hypothetical protein FVQ83_01650 [Chloroflexi bacterium]|nr:hypothetical protein [Chloroflexota bacterium]